MFVVMLVLYAGCGSSERLLLRVDPHKAAQGQCRSFTAGVTFHCTLPEPPPQPPATRSLSQVLGQPLLPSLSMDSHGSSSILAAIAPPLEISSLPPSLGAGSSSTGVAENVRGSPAKMAPSGVTRAGGRISPIRIGGPVCLRYDR